MARIMSAGGAPLSRAESTCAHRSEHRVVVLEHREHEHGDVRRDAGDLAGGLDTAHAGHLDVHDDDVGPECDGGADGVLASADDVNELVTIAAMR
jgi:hypothetical protein